MARRHCRCSTPAEVVDPKTGVSYCDEDAGGCGGVLMTKMEKELAGIATKLWRRNDALKSRVEQLEDRVGQLEEARPVPDVPANGSEPHDEPAASNGTAPDNWLRGAAEIASYIGAKPDRVKKLNFLGRIPLHKEGRWLVGKRSELDAWLRSGGGKLP